MNTKAQPSGRPAPTAYDAAAIAALGAEPLPEGSKGMPLTWERTTLAELAGSGLQALLGELPMPLLALRREALAHNIATMAAFCAEHDVLLSPHGKTTMAPQIFAAQIDAGAWAITVATATQLRVCRRFGIQRLLLANPLLEDGAIAWVSAELRRDPGFELFALVDSVVGARRLAAGLERHRAPRPLPVLLEVGYTGGRAGVRDGAAGLQVAEAVAAAPALELAGVSGYEGLIADSNLAETIERVDEHLDQIASIATDLRTAGLVAAEPILSAGGSAYFDRVLARLGPLPGRLVLRSGCYVTQDGGFYGRVSPLAGRAELAGPRLRNALELWSTVLSRPEPGRAIAGFGKRDAPYDMGLPTPTHRRPPGGEDVPLAGVEVVALNDQHAHLTLPAGATLEPGDLLRCEVSHPCAAFDRWRAIPVLDGEDVLVDAVMTFF